MAEREPIIVSSGDFQDTMVVVDDPNPSMMRLLPQRCESFYLDCHCGECGSPMHCGPDIDKMCCLNVKCSRAGTWFWRPKLMSQELATWEKVEADAS